MTHDAETVFVHQVEFAYNRLHAVGPVQNRKENRLASADQNYSFDCPQCDERLSVSREKMGNQIHCVHCGEQIHAPSPMSTADKLLAGLIDDDEFEHPGSLKIDGIEDDQEDGSSWHLKCHICDSTLLVSVQQVGKKVKCNDCYSMLDVLPNAAARKLGVGIADGADLEVIDEDIVIPAPSTSKKRASDSSELTLAPALELAPEITEAQKETFLDELVEEDIPMELTSEHLDEDEPIELMEPVATAKTADPMFDLGAPDSSEDDDDDSDEMIEMLDIAPEELNQPAAIVAPVANARSAPTELPRMPRKGKRPAAIPVEADDEDEAPVRVHAKRRPNKKQSATPARARASRGFLFEDAPMSDVLDKAMGVLKTGNIWIWALVSIVVMAIGSSIWHWLAPDQLDAETSSLANRMLYWGAGTIFGLGVFFIGYIILMYVCGVIFRETAQGETKVDSVKATDAADFTSTMLLFGFSMAIAALPCMFFGYMWLSIPVQFLLGGCFLYAAWKNQAAFSIISGSIVSSFSQCSESWKKWLAVAGISAAGGIIGGLLLEVYWPIISVFTSIAGSIVVAMSTLLYAAVSGWHCGNVVEKMNQADAQ